MQRDCSDAAGVVAEEAFGVHREDPLAALLVGAARAHHQRPGRPGRRPVALRRGCRQDLQLVHAPSTLAVRRTEAVRAGVAAADDDHPLALGGDRRRGEVTFLHPVGRGEVLHGQVDPGQFPAGCGQVPAHCGTAGEQDRVVRRPQPLSRKVDADVARGDEPGALRAHLLEPTLEVALFHLELGDAVAQQPADPVGPLEDRHVVTGPGELLRGGEAGRAGADHRDGRPTADHRRLRSHPALGKGAVDDLDLDLLDGDGTGGIGGVNPEHTGCLARGGAEPAGELREVVRGVQPIDRHLPVVATDEVVPLGDEVAERAAVVAERDAAVHAASRLRSDVLGPEVLVDLVPVLDPDVDRASPRQLTRGRQETLGVRHRPPP